MASTSARNALGFGALGLGVGLLVLPFFYITMVRTQVAVRGDPMWASIFIGILLAPAAVMAIYGWTRKEAVAE